MLQRVLDYLTWAIFRPQGYHKKGGRLVCGSRWRLRGGYEVADISFEVAEEVQRIAEGLIDYCHPHLADAKDKIAYLFKHGTCDYIANCHKNTAYEREATGKIFAIIVRHSGWDERELTQKRAEIDHQLCHIGRHGGTRHIESSDEIEPWWSDAADPCSWYKKEHDVEEFTAVVSRHGVNDSSIQKFAEATRKHPYQLCFDDLEMTVRRLHRRAMKLRRAI